MDLLTPFMDMAKRMTTAGKALPAETGAPLPEAERERAKT